MPIGTGIFLFVISLVSFPFQHRNGFFLPHSLKFYNITMSQVFLIKDKEFVKLYIFQIFIEFQNSQELTEKLLLKKGYP